jgi:hypothetical protein
MEAGPRFGLLRRAAAVIARPSQTWEVIAAEPLDWRGLIFRYAAPLAAIRAVCSVAGPLAFHYAIASIRLQPDMGALVLQAAAEYVLTLIGVVLLALWADLLAPAFGGVRGQGAKLVVYAGTASWVAGFFAIYPAVGLPAEFLGALWSLRILYLGLGPVMQAPEDNRLTYFAAILAGGVIMAVVAGMLIARAAEFGGPLSMG